MQITNSIELSFTNKQTINKRQPHNDPIRKWPTETQHIRDESARRGVFWGQITLFEDDNVRITIANRNDTNATREESEAWKAFSRVTIFCKISGSVTVVHDVELADMFFSKFMTFLNQHELTIEDFIEYARNRLLSDLFDKFMEEMGWTISHQRQVSEQDFDRESEPLTNSRLRMSTRKEISVLSVDEALQIVPSHRNKLKANMFYAEYYNSNFTDE